MTYCAFPFQKSHLYQEPGALHPSIFEIFYQLLTFHVHCHNIFYENKKNLVIISENSRPPKHENVTNSEEDV